MSITVKKVICFLSFFFFIPMAQASIHIEPYGSVGGAFSNSVSPKSSIFMAYNLGSRLGYDFLNFGIGLDLFWTYYDVGNNGSAPGSTVIIPKTGSEGLREGVRVDSNGEVVTPFHPFSIGVFGNVDLPFLFNAYGTVFYTFGERELMSHQGYGVKVGVSYLSTFFVQLNLELQWANYVCMTEAKCKRDFNIFSGLVSLSVPLPDDMFEFGSSSSDSESLDSLSEEEEIKM